MIKRDGFALAMVLWISAILMAATLFLLGNYKKSVNYAVALNDKLEAEIKADSYIVQFNYYALTGKFFHQYIENKLKGFPKKLSLLQTKIQLDKNTTLILRSGGDMLHMYALSPSIVNTMMQNHTHSRENFKDAYQDWIDLDNMPLLNGAEGGYYQANTAYNVSNMGTIQHPEELFLIKGFQDLNESLKEKIIDNFHYGTSSIFDYAVISPGFLKNLIQVDDFELNQLYELYKDNYDLYEKKIYAMLSSHLDADYFGVSYLVDGIIIVNQGKSSIRREFNALYKNYHQRPITIFKNHLTTKYEDLSKKKL